MTVGYRHWAGIGTKQSCKDALPWYKSAADSGKKNLSVSSVFRLSLMVHVY